MRDYVFSSEFRHNTFDAGWERLFLQYWRHKVFQEAGRLNEVVQTQRVTNTTNYGNTALTNRPWSSTPFQRTSRSWRNGIKPSAWRSSRHSWPSACRTPKYSWQRREAVKIEERVEKDKPGMTLIRIERISRQPGWCCCCDKGKGRSGESSNKIINVPLLRYDLVA